MISVIVADDEPLVRSGIRGLLETAEDVEVVAEAGSGAEALLVQRHRPDVVLMDIHMARWGRVVGGGAGVPTRKSPALPK